MKDFAIEIIGIIGLAVIAIMFALLVVAPAEKTLIQDHIMRQHGAR